jgi:hypothetical protein
MAFNLDALASEGDGRAVFEFTFGGETYELPPEMDVRAASALSAGRVYEGLGMLLGDVQWSRMQAAEQILTEKMLSALLQEYAAHMGIDLGESSASTGSSRSTGRPSKRTSNGSTAARSRR